MGENKISYWTPIIEMIESIIVAWKAQWLSLSSRVILIKLVLSTIPNYYLLVLKVRPSIIQTIQKMLREFLWIGNMNGEKKVPLVSLEKVAQVKYLGGARIHDLEK